MGAGPGVADHGGVSTKLHPPELGARSAGPGSIVTVEDRFGRYAEYELLADPDGGLPRHRVRASSSAGVALDGARPGDIVWFPEGEGRPRRFTVRDVAAPPGD